ncbi:MAG: DedA family protein [Halorientalis sp.]
MFQGLLDAVLGFVHQYGYLAVFVYMTLETAFILHYVPSEVVVPFAGAQLVHDPVSFVLFVVDTTAGATFGSVIAYLLFGQYGREALEHYGHVIHVSADRLDRSESVFRRYGQSTVFWARMLPFLRAFISIPAGLAEMNLRRFTVYSAGGALVFNTLLTYLVYSGAGTTSPLEVGREEAATLLGQSRAYVGAHTDFVIVLAGIAAVTAAAVWVSRDWIRSNPGLAKQVGLHSVRLVGVFVGGVFVIGSLTAPEHAFGVITAVWDDPRFWVQHGVSEQVSLFVFGIVIAFVGVSVYELGEGVERTDVQTAGERVVGRLRDR